MPQLSYPLCFDTLAKPFSRNSFLLILIQNARGGGSIEVSNHDPSLPTLSLSFPRANNNVFCSNSLRTLCAKTPGCTPLPYNECRAHRARSRRSLEPVRLAMRRVPLLRV